MDQAQLQKALAAQQNPQKAEEDYKKQQDMLEKRNVMLQSLMTNEAKERCISLLFLLSFL